MQPIVGDEVLDGPCGGILRIMGSFGARGAEQIGVVSV